ncbi:MAG: TetR family transcriptional regulator [Tabrizicola sp.]|nr:TetR family transcriptional regulator [Tabrizicola sp.]
MEQIRRAYRRESEETRREALISATQSLVAEGGPEAATVRAIAARAGVTPGLIRHYFSSKDDLTRAAYIALIDGMTEKGAEALREADDRPEARLAAFIVASLTPPVVDISAVVLWAGYMHKIRADSELRGVHQGGYLRYRNTLQSLIADLPREVSAARLRRDAIASNAMIDGLWLEGSILPDGFADGEIVATGLLAIGTIVGCDLLSHMKLAKPESAAE